MNVTPQYDWPKYFVDEGIEWCRFCPCPAFYLMLVGIGSRGSTFAAGFVCRRRQAHFAADLPVCSSACAAAAWASEKQHPGPFTVPMVPSIDGCGGNRRMEFTSTAFCAKDCDGDCVKLQYEARAALEGEAYTAREALGAAEDAAEAAAEDAAEAAAEDAAVKDM
jgi:hypothetical protein